MNDTTKKMIAATNRTIETMCDYCASDAWENKGPEWEAFINACTDFMKLDPPHSDHEYVGCVRGLLKSRYFSDSTNDDFSNCDDSYLNKLEYPDIPTDQRPYIKLLNLADPPERWVDSPWLNVDYRTAVIYEQPSSHFSSKTPPDEYVIMGYRIDDDGDLELLVVPKGAEK